MLVAKSLLIPRVRGNWCLIVGLLCRNGLIGITFLPASRLNGTGRYKTIGCIDCLVDTFIDAFQSAKDASAKVSITLRDCLDALTKDRNRNCRSVLCL